MSATAQPQEGPRPRAEMPKELDARHLRRRVIELAVLIAAVALLVSAAPGLGDVRQRFAEANPALIVLVALLQLCSTLSYVVAFRDVFCRRMSWGFSYRIGMAEQATNVLLPTGGAGGLALGAWALREGGMNTEYIGRRSVALFIITSIPSFACLVIGGPLLLLGVLPGGVPTVVTAVFTGLAIAGVLVAASLPAILSRTRPEPGASRVSRTWRSISKAIAGGVVDTGMLLRSGRWKAIGGAIGYLGFDILSITVAFAAFGASPEIGPLIFAYVIGQLGGLIPLPAGIGGTDGGLIGALVLYGNPFSQTAAAVLAYRAFQVGIPAALGAIAFIQLRKELSETETPAAVCTQLAEPLPAR